jgi:multidrug efflux system outer membrane protein
MTLMNKRLLRPGALAALALALALAGCATSPVYETPAMDIPAAFKEATLSPEAAQQWKAAQPADALARGKWWAIFADDTLDALQARAMKANQDLKAAAARVAQARALSRQAQADRYPQVDAGFGPTRQRRSNAAMGLSQDADNAPQTFWRAQLSASYEADLFGRVAAGAQAALADAQQSAALYESVRLAMQADVAQTYFQIRRLDAERSLYAQTIALRRQTLALVQQRYDAGDISELDLARAQTELSTASAQALAIERQRAAAEHALAILLGEAPSSFSLSADPLGRVDVAIPAGLPSSLLERRPDISAAERAMAAANARVGAARAAFFPRLTLTGALGYESAHLSDLFEWSSRTFLLGPLAGAMLSLPIFDAGRRDAQLDQARAVYEEDVAAYRQTVLGAFREVEDALSGLRILGQETSVRDEAVRSAERAAELSRIQYREGSVAYLDVIDADRAVLQQRQASVRLDGERALAAVALVRAIGGGWDLPGQAAAAQAGETDG